MTQNNSHAVMSQRHEPHDSLDDFPTPPWAGRALCEIITPKRDSVCMEPACGRRYLARGLRTYFGKVLCADIHDYGLPQEFPDAVVIEDFLFNPSCANWGVDWIITNPPFRLAEQFTIQALDIARVGVAMLVRTQFLESKRRYRELFFPRPPTRIAQFVERVPMVKGRCDPKASTATAYCWVIWRKPDLMISREKPPTFSWIPPCRLRLELTGDYD